MKGLDNKKYNDEVSLLIYPFIFLSLYASFKKTKRPIVFVRQLSARMEYVFSANIAPILY
ncbi:hypothetical protein BCV72DRAFT_219023 [Rhizopus microsporus var. microsporus]|uniref:Uncharacterized protein n=2 Tax=Rhizopus microsporus TaxID=58291 RepID=A0A2G4SZJ0_RHIZD|nr:uncharacterized protein RHIMIDRAFT_278345 [Rhizopus microsporus ATCC 52813]ORE12131.1 hypothetical protein BCV72DRAFT_219023 [Rhizopus microsporus var. microsporus]PHZ14179.1 hypothetical protein RHIMIDRAFT_278345 [Rhizopus microsporus ATCC 52813]